MHHEVRQPFYGRSRVKYLLWLLNGGPQGDSAYNQSDENALEQVVDKAGEPCSRSTERERVFCGQEAVGMGA